MEKVDGKGQVYLFPLIFLLVSLSVTSGHVSAQTSPSGGPAGLTVGDYAEYAESNLSLASIAGYGEPAPVSFTANSTVYNAPQYTNELWYSNNSTVFFSHIAFSWKVDQIRANTIQLNYTLVLYGVEGKASPNLVLSKEVQVSQYNNSLYLLNGTLIGTWPYWLSTEYLSSSLFTSNPPLVLVHQDHAYDIPLGGSKAEKVLFNSTEFVSLPQGSLMPNVTATSSFAESTLSIQGLGPFKTDRLLVTYPYLRSSPGPGGTQITGPQGTWVAVYDRFSGFMLALDQWTWDTDDVLLHSGLNVWQFGFDGGSLVLQSTNLKISADANSSQDILPLTTVASIAVVSICLILYLRRVQGRRSASG